MPPFVITCERTLYAMRLQKFKWARWFCARTCTPELEAEYQALCVLRARLDPTGATWRRYLPEDEKPPRVETPP